ncbi:TRAP transporter large permease [Hoeflea poritis]|uniref:TRAP transporter large permease protein n=1 Tax=Hoeflea poritis TaxID=2993659 RepID=A0ABT4VUR0_9HYPH|nr:TRAP transporter large permease [Hoeflea poritis]MDA4848443.1 TRAP transporter large permease [Hoeflea poritis]
MSGLELGLLSVGAIVGLIYLGMHVAIVLAAVSFVGLWIFKGKFALSVTLLTQAVTESISSYVFGVVPLFVLMGLLVGKADIGRDTFRAANHFLHRILGGLGVATVIANTAFAAVTGISIASAAVFTRVAVPEMLRLGYQRRFAVGVVTGSSVLGMLIPPSLLLIVYALVAEQSVGAMFVAGIVPGLLLAAVFCVIIVGMARFSPRRVFSERTEADDREELTNLEALMLLLPLIVLIGLVLGGIYGGFFTPTEAGAAGVAGALVIALLRRRLNWSSFWETLLQAGQITASISLLVIGATVYSRMVSIMGLPNALANTVSAAELSFLALILIYILIVIALGTLIDAISIILIMIPIFLPLASAFPAADPIWFGILTVIAAEIGLLTPPMGLSAYVVKSSLDNPDITLADIFLGTMPFVFGMIAIILLIVAFPQLTRVFL